MAKTVTIPSNVNWLDVEINGVHYQYKGGETVSVPDEVAALLENNAAEEPHGTRATGEVKNAGLVKVGDKEEAAPVYTDAEGNLTVVNKIVDHPAAVVHFKDSDGDITADIGFNEVYSISQMNMAILGTLGGVTFTCQKASTTLHIFQAILTDTTADTQTVKDLQWSKTDGISLTEKVYDLTEHSDDNVEA